MKQKDKGRFGDTEIRKVDGERAHVNPIEARVIDKYGDRGRQLVSLLGSGTINPETGLREYAFPWMAALSAGSTILGGVGQMFGASRQADRQSAYAQQIQDLSGVTPSEREYMKRQRAIAKGGDPLQNRLMQEQMNRVVGNIRQTGAENLQRTEGSIIGQGMENSIVAAELRRKTSGETMKNIAEQSRRISEANRVAQERTKQAAEDRLLQMQMGVDRRGQQAQLQAAGISAGIPSQGERNWGLLGNIAQAGFGGFEKYGMTNIRDFMDSWDIGGSEEIG